MVAVAVAALAFSAGTANASTVHTENASKCGTKWCTTVKGKGLRVDSATVSRRGGKAFNGYPYIEVAAPKHKVYFVWGPKVKNKVKLIWQFKGWKLPNKTTLCIGVAPKKTYQDHVGDACVVVHK